MPYFGYYDGTYFLVLIGAVISMIASSKVKTTYAKYGNVRSHSGMTAMEARCCGTEAIVYQDTACEEIVNQFGGIAVPKGAKNLYEAVKKLRGEDVL